MAASKSSNPHRVRYEQHGMHGTPAYTTWKDMIKRCHNPNSTGWKWYGAHGISVCDEWRNSFLSFFNHMGPRPLGHTLDRIDVHRNYEPGNCRWADAKTQARNRDYAIKFTFDGKSMCIAEWAEFLGIPADRIRNRVRRGMPYEAVFSREIYPPGNGSKFIAHSNKRLSKSS